MSDENKEMQESTTDKKVVKEQPKTKKILRKTTILYKKLLPVPITPKKVFVQSIPKKSVLGLHKWTHPVSGKLMNKNKIGYKANDKIQFLNSKSRGGLLNGLSYKPWKHEGLQVVDEDDKPMTLQDKYELKWGLPKGYLNNRPSPPKDTRPYHERTYYQNKVVTLKDGTTTFDLGNMEDDLSYMGMLDSKYVANSEREHKAHKWPKATHLIALEGESDEIKYQKTRRRGKAFNLLESDELHLPMQRKFVHVLGLASSVTDDLTEQQVYNLLYDFIEKSNFQPGSNLDKFEELANLLKTASGREELNARFLLKRALDTRVVFEHLQSYTWVRSDGRLVIGETYNEVIEFLLNPKKESLVEELKREIKAKIL